MTTNQAFRLRTQNQSLPDNGSPKPSIAKEPKSALHAVEEKYYAVEEELTVLWHQIQDWQQDNHYIHSGYRPASDSYLKSIRSLGYLHNESVNIYSHLLGAVAAVICSLYFYRELSVRYDTATADDVFVFACFFAGAATCLGMSAIFHTISNHSHPVARFGNKLDYLGIVALIWGSFIPTLFYGFQDDVRLVKVYWTMITTIGAGCALVSTANRFRTPQLRPFRAGMFVAMGLSAAFPVLHGLKLYGLSQMHDMVGLRWVILQGGLYIAGAAIYAARFPERVRPGAFDIWGSSHQIFHVLVLLAAAAHLVGLIKAFDYKHSRAIVPQHDRIFKISAPEYQGRP